YEIRATFPTPECFAFYFRNTLLASLLFRSPDIFFSLDQRPAIIAVHARICTIRNFCPAPAKAFSNFMEYLRVSNRRTTCAVRHHGVPNTRWCLEPQRNWPSAGACYKIGTYSEPFKSYDAEAETSPTMKASGR